MSKVLPAFMCLGVLASQVSYAEVNERTFKVAFVQAENHPHGIGAKKFGEILEEKSGGKLKVRVFGNGVLGGDQQVISSVQGGTVDMTMVTPGLLTGLEKGFGIFGLPFTFNDHEEVDAVLDGEVGQELLGKLPEHGLVGLDYWDHGFRHMTNNERPVQTVNDIEGLKIRVMQIPTAIETFNTLGANAIPMSFTELYTGLETGTVDGQENPLAAIETAKFYEVQDYLSLTGHTYDPLVTIFSKKVWNKLTDEEKELIASAAKEAGAYERKVSRESAGSARQTLAEHGMKINEVSPEAKAEMRAKVQPVIDKFSKEYGQDLVQEMQSTIQEVRNQ